MGSTIGDVARLAGVGRGTVSRVLNDRPNVDPNTRQRVQAAIAELEYVPSTTARRLSLGRTQTIGVVVPYLTTPSVVQRLRGIESALVRAGLDMIVFNVETVQRRDTVLRDLPRPDRIDGMILVSIAPHDSELAQIRRAGVPVVLIDAHHRGISRVVCDDIGGGVLVAQHLRQLGHTRIGFIGDETRPILGVPSSDMRLRGVERELRVDGLAIPDELVALGERSREHAREAALAMLSLPRRPTAIIAANDIKAMGVLEAAERLGLAIPGDLSLTGYDDIEAAEYFGLTTVHQPLEDTGTRAVERLVALIAGLAPGVLREVLPVELVIRRTTAAPPASASA